MPERSASEEQFVSSKLDEALTDFGLPTDSPLRGLLNRDAVVIDGVGLQGQKAFGIKIARPDGDITLAERLVELRNDFMYKDRFPKETPTVAAVGGQCLRPTAENFDQIASGAIVVR